MSDPNDNRGLIKQVGGSSTGSIHSNAARSQKANAPPAARPFGLFGRMQAGINRRCDSGPMRCRSMATHWVSFKGDENDPNKVYLCGPCASRAMTDERMRAERANMSTAIDRPAPY